MAAGRDVVELGRDANAIAALAYAAFDDVTNAELLGDLFQMDSLAFIDE